MNWIKNSLFLVIAWSIGFILIFLFFEAVLRFSPLNDPWQKTVKLNIIRNRVIEYKLDGLYQNSEDRIYYERDEFGLRDNCTSAESVDILTIGGSTTDQRYVAFESTYQYVLQSSLTSYFGKTFCVSNAGVDGHSTYGHITSFEEWFPLIPKLRPKLVLLYIGVNDVNFNRSGPNIGYDIKFSRGFKKWANQFKVIQTLRPLSKTVKEIINRTHLVYEGHHPRSYTEKDYITESLNGLTPAKSKENSRLFRERLKILVAYVRKMGASPVCVTQPHLFVKVINGQKRGVSGVLGDGYSGLDYDYSIKQMNEMMFETCGVENTIDLYNAVFETDHFYDGAHTTKKGSEFVGKLLFEELKQRKFLGLN